MNKKKKGWMEMKYQITGSVMQALEIELEPNEVIYTESGAMFFMSSNVEMSTNFKGGLFSSIKRAMTGESMALTYFQAHQQNGKIGFSPVAPGKVIPLEVSPGKEYVCQKDSFMVAEDGVKLDIYFQKKIMTGIFGGEGFIMQRLSGQGLAFVEVDGEVIEMELQPGEEVKVDTSHVAMMESTVTMDIERVKGLKNIIFGGEGLFLTTLKGPGKVWLQTLPLANLAGRIGKYLGTSSGNNDRGASSGLGDLFND